MVFSERRRRPLLEKAVQGYVKPPSWDTTVSGYVNISTPGCRIWPFSKLRQCAWSAASFHHPRATLARKYNAKRRVPDFLKFFGVKIGYQHTAKTDFMTGALDYSPQQSI